GASHRPAQRTQSAIAHAVERGQVRVADRHLFQRAGAGPKFRLLRRGHVQVERLGQSAVGRDEILHQIILTRVWLIPGKKGQRDEGDYDGLTLMTRNPTYSGGLVIPALSSAGVAAQPPIALPMPFPACTHSAALPPRSKIGSSPSPLNWPTSRNR